MRIVTLNARHGLTPRGSVDTDALARYCAGLHADILALQEIDVRTRRVGGADQVAAVARATGLTPCFGPSERMGRRRETGNALFVRGLIDEAKTLVLPRSGHRDERSAILANVIAGDRVVTVAATHLSEHPAEATLQLEAILVALRKRHLPRVVLGDLNLRAEQVAPTIEQRAYALAATSAPTFPAIGPTARPDHFLSEGLDVLSVDVLDAGPVSDHRALVVEVH